jgi:hypothetical protein
VWSRKRLTFFLPIHHILRGASAGARTHLYSRGQIRRVAALAVRLSSFTPVSRSPRLSEAVAPGFVLASSFFPNRRPKMGYKIAIKENV